jgi:tetratricopeptide (TPR) repeat protein
VADVGTIIGIVGIGVGVVGGGGAIGIWTAWQRERRDSTDAIWKAYDKQIELADARGDSQAANQFRREYEQQLGGWRAQQALIGTTHSERPAVTAITSKIRGQENTRRLLVDSETLSTALLSANDYFVRGIAYDDIDENEKALDAYDRAIELAAQEIKRARSDLALSVLGRRISALQPPPEYFYNRGLILMKLERPTEAVHSFDDALQISPTNPQFHSDRGVALKRLGKFADALAEYNRALQLDPTHAIALYNRACLYSVQNQHDSALEDLEAAIELDRSNSRWAQSDRELDNIRDDPRFQELVGEHEPPTGSSPLA